MTRITAIVVAVAVALGLAPTVHAGDRALSPDPLAYVAPSRPYTTLHTALDLDIDLERQTIAGSVTHTMRALTTGMDEVDLNCVELEIESVKIDGADVAFDYPVPGNQATSWIESIDDTRADDRLVIHTGKRMARGEEFTVTIAYHGAPKRGLYWIAPEKGLPTKRYEVWSQGEGEDNRFWIPCHDYPDDKSTFEGRFRVKKGLYVLSNGVLVSREDKGEKTEFSWKLDEPQASYLIMVAASTYDVHEDMAGDTPLLYVVPPGTPDAMVQRGYGLTPDMVQFYEKEIGIPYPFGKYAQVSVQNFIYGGMENSTATVMNMKTLYDESAALTSSQQGLVAHELAHMWWGDMVTCREWSHLWLNEGFATYYQSLYTQYHDGDDAFRYEVLGRHRGVVANDDKDARPVVTEFYSRTDARNSANVYIKGSSVLHMLRFLLGEDDYRAVIRHYGETRKYGSADTGDLSQSVKDVTGQNYDWFFEQWIYLAGHPKFKVSKRWDEDAGVLELTVRQTQTVGGLVPLFRVPLDVEVTCDGAATVHRITVDRESQVFYFDCASQPQMVVFDKGDWILKTLDFPKRTGELLYQLEHGDYMARVRAAEALGKEAPASDVVAALRGVVLADGHWGLRREAALALGKIGGDDAIAALADGLKSSEGRVRVACADGLGELMGNEAAAKHLRGLVTGDPAVDVRAAAVASLVKMRADKAADACYAALKQESNQGVVRNAGLNGLATLEATTALKTVARYATAGNDRTYRHTAIDAYAKLAAKLPEARDREKAVDFLAPMLDDWYIRTRQAVITALQTVDSPAAIAVLERAATHDPLEQLRGQARRAESLVRARQDKNESVDEMQARVQRLEDRIKAMSEDIDNVKKNEAVQ